MPTVLMPPASAGPSRVPWRAARPRWLRSGRVIAGLTVALLVLGCAMLAPLLAPHDPDEQNLLTTLLPAAWQTGGDHAYLLGTDGLGRWKAQGYNVGA